MVFMVFEFFLFLKMNSKTMSDEEISYCFAFCLCSGHHVFILQKPELSGL